MNKQEAKQLLKKYNKGEATQDEALLLEIWYHQETELRGTESEREDNTSVKNQMWTEIQSKTTEKHQEKNKKPIIIVWTRIAVAALLVISLSFGAIIYFNSLQTTSSQNEDFSGIATGLRPGKNKAILTFSDGSAIDLSDEKEGITIFDNHIAYTDGTQLKEESGNRSLSESDRFLVLTTPNGGQYQVTLPDGTNVWLNSASSLKYPTHFTGNERRVELIGEGYFEVIENKKQPFIVQSAEQEVRVLGTHFNVNAYENENAIKTTLLEGSVQVLAYHSKALNTQLLKPGQESFLKKGDDRFLINEIDAKKSIAWKEGYFRFDDMDIQSIMRAISRWYDIEVYYEGQIPNAKFIGRVSKYKNIHQVLTLLESTGEVNFKIESNLGSKGERRVVVRK